MALIAAVTTTMNNPRRDGEAIWWFVEFPGIETMDDLDGELIENGTVLGNKLKLAPIGDGRTQRRIVGREEIIIGKAIIATITPAHIDCVE